MSEPNRTPEQIASDRIDQMLAVAGWSVQDKSQIDFNQAKGVAVREYPTDSGPADYVLFVERRPIGVIEAKRPEMGQNINVVAEQSAKYAAAKLKWIKDNKPLPLLYESTGEITLFRDERDPKPRSREVFWFHQPKTLAEGLGQSQTLRARLQQLPLLSEDGLRKVQVDAITSLEKSFAAGRPRALIQMATGAGKTFTAITSIYRLLKYADAKRILFLVDTKNLGEQAEQEFMAYLPNDDNRKFTELYNVQRLSSNYIADSSQMVISTIQRLYSILKGEPMDETAELENPAEHRIVAKFEKLFSALDKGVAELKAAKKKLELYRQSLLKAAFEGRLTEKWRRRHLSAVSAQQLCFLSNDFLTFFGYRFLPCCHVLYHAVKYYKHLPHACGDSDLVRLTCLDKP